MSCSLQPTASQDGDGGREHDDISCVGATGDMEDSFDNNLLMADSKSCESAIKAQTEPSQPTIMETEPSQPINMETGPSQPTITETGPSQPTIMETGPLQPTITAHTGPSQPTITAHTDGVAVVPQLQSSSMRSGNVSISSAPVLKPDICIKRLSEKMKAHRRKTFGVLGDCIRARVQKLYITQSNLDHDSPWATEMSDVKLDNALQMLADSSLDDECCMAAAQVLQLKKSHLKELDFSHFYFWDGAAEKLADGLKNSNHSLTSFDLSFSNLQIAGPVLMTGIVLGPHPHTLGLHGSKLNKDTCDILAKAMEMPSSQLKNLDLSYNPLTDAGVEKLLQALSNKECVLEKLSLCTCQITETSCVTLAKVLQQSSLRELNLSVNPLGDEGVKLLCTGLMSPHCRLNTLGLNQCHLSKASCEMMLKGTPSHLRELDMSNNDLEDEGVKMLCVGLRDPQCKLETLRLSACMITHKGCSFLSSALKSNPFYLKELDLSYNHPGDSGVRELTDRLNDPSCKLETFRYEHGEEYMMEPGLRKYACELTLDPNTADIFLSFSEGNRKATCKKEQLPYHERRPCPHQPERFELHTMCIDRHGEHLLSHAQVLCREGLSGCHGERLDSLCTSPVGAGLFGRFYWEVKWSGRRVDIAVAYKSMQRKGCTNDSYFGYDGKSWNARCTSNGYLFSYYGMKTAIPAPSSRSNRVGVYLDWSAGTLSYYSVSSNTLTHLHTFLNKFTEPLYPGFYVAPTSSVTLCQITSSRSFSDPVPDHSSGCLASCIHKIAGL